MKGEHAVELFLHCAEGSRVEAIPGGYAVTRDAHSIRVSLPDLPGAASRVLEGSESPLGGWVSRRFDRKVAAPTIVWTARLTGDAVCRTDIDCE